MRLRHQLIIQGNGPNDIFHINIMQTWFTDRGRNCIIQYGGPVVMKRKTPRLVVDIVTPLDTLDLRDAFTDLFFWRA